MRIEDFDVRSYLDRKGISYSTRGDNVSRGWIGISCLFCSDHSNHLGINLAKNTFYCLKCQESGTAFKLVKEIEGLSENREVFKVMEEYSGTHAYKSAEKEVEHHWQKEIVYPADCTKNFWPRHREFLEERRYDPDTVIKKYDLYATGPVGDFSHRIIIPIFFNKKIISFVGRDVTGLQEIRYKNAPDLYGTKPTKDCLYGLDNIHGGKAIIVEGVLDAWRLGDGAVATFGTKYTDKQVRLLKGLNQVFLCFDHDAIRLSKEFAWKLSTLVKKITVVDISLKDPDTMSDDEAKYLKKHIRF